MQLRRQPQEHERLQEGPGHLGNNDVLQQLREEDPDGEGSRRRKREKRARLKGKRRGSETRQQERKGTIEE